MEEKCHTSYDALTKLVQYRYNSVEIDVHCVSNFLHLDVTTVQERRRKTHLKNATGFMGSAILAYIPFRNKFSKDFLRCFMLFMASE